jgi:hypothetical protein
MLCRSFLCRSLVCGTRRHMANRQRSQRTSCARSPRRARRTVSPARKLRAPILSICAGVVTYYDPSIGSHRALVRSRCDRNDLCRSCRRFDRGSLPWNIGGCAWRERRWRVCSHHCTPPDQGGWPRSVLPANPPRPSLTLMKSGILDSQWIEVEGVIRSFRRVQHNVALQLAMDGGTVTLSWSRRRAPNYSGLGRRKSARPCQCRPDVQHQTCR